VGLSLMEIFCTHGANVIGVDNSPKRVNELNNGEVSPDLISNSKLKAFIRQNLYLATSNYAAISDCNIVIIAVPTPIDSDNNPDLSILRKACRDIATHLKKDALVINESTSFPGTLRNLVASEIAELRVDKAESLDFACSPERVNPGVNLPSTKSTPRVVSGITDSSRKRVLEFYKSFIDEVHLVIEPEIAEMAKLLENSYRLINIAFVNELNDLCNKVGIDLREVIQAASTKPFGFAPFYPSAGIGGHCIPIDPEYLLEFAKASGSDLPTLRSSAESNRNHAKRIIRFVQSKVGNLSGKSVLIEGVTYKSDVSDVRETPAEKLRELLSELGAEVSWHDPLIKSWKNSLPSNSRNFDVVIFCMAHQVTDLKRIVNSGRFIFDLTGTLENTEKVIVF